MSVFHSLHIRTAGSGLSPLNRICELALSVSAQKSWIAFSSLLTVLLLTGSFASAADYSTGVTAKILKKTSVTGNGQKIAYPQTDKAEVTAMIVDLAPGAETGWHKHPIPVYAYVVSGTLSVELEDGKTLLFGDGEVIIEVVNTLHNGKNVGTGPLKLAVFYLGAEGMPNVIKPAKQL